MFQRGLGLGLDAPQTDEAGGLTSAGPQRRGLLAPGHGGSGRAAKPVPCVIDIYPTILEVTGLHAGGS